MDIRRPSTALLLALLALQAALAAPAAAQRYCGSVLPIMVQASDGVVFTPGCSNYALKYATAGASGGYTALEFPACPAGPVCEGLSPSARFRCQMANGYSCCVDSGVCITEAAGNMSGPAQQSWMARFDSDTDLREGICDASGGGVGTYQGNGARRFIALITTAPFDACIPPERLGEFFMTFRPAISSGANVVVQFLGNLDWARVPTPVRRSTWGSLKAVYR